VQNLSKNKIKWIRSFHQKKFRDEFDLFLVEGDKMVQEAIDLHPKLIACLCYTESSSLSIPETLSDLSYICSDNDLKSISCLKTPNKSLILLKKFSQDIQQASFYLVLDQIQDPGNLGTIIRIADWYGIQQIICSHSTVDVYNPKVVQATMGGIFRIAVQYCDLDQFIPQTQLPVYGALLEGVNIYEQTLKPEGILIVGNEGNGISPSIQQLITNPITIPRFGQAESLNVSIATGILISEFFRNS
jgi:RNA methyltransferase, TrmH family